MMRLAALAAFAVAPGAALLAKVTPTQKVVTMLSEMKAKGEKAMDDEQKLFAKYAEWADDKSKDLGFEIEDGKARIEELIATITKAEADVAQLGREIKDLDEEITKLSKEKDEATTVRESEHEEYMKVSTDYAQSVDALKRAIVEVSSQDVEHEQAAVLLQTVTKHLHGMPRVLAAFLQARTLAGRSDGSGAPEVAAYEFQSGGILSLLEGLLKKFKTELSEVEEAEANQAHEFELVELHLSDTITRDKSDVQEKTVAKGQRATDSAKAKGELERAKADKAADEKLKAETEATFKVKKEAYAQNQKVRKAELEALGKALEIMSSDSVSGSYAKRINLAQRPAASTAAAPSFLQLRSRTRRVSAGNRAAELLSRRAKEVGSERLAHLAAQAAASPFAKVIDMVESLIAKLKQEAAEEAEHKAWCDEQLKANKLKRNKKTAQSEKLAAQIEGLASKISDMGERIAKLIEEQQGLTKAMKEATELRSEEKKENEATIADAKAGSEAVKNALVVLKEFYAGQASLLQEGQAPEMEAYKGMQGAKGGVLGMLEVIQSDFMRLKHETESEEKAAAKEYDKFMEDSTATKEEKHKSEVQLKLDKDQAEFDKAQREKDLKGVEAELAKANEYFEELKPSCLEVHVSFEDRAAKRKEEIEALKEAWKILDQKS